MKISQHGVRSMDGLGGFYTDKLCGMALWLRLPLFSKGLIFFPMRFMFLERWGAVALRHSSIEDGRAVAFFLV